MTCLDQQIRDLRNLIKTCTLLEASKRVGITPKTARKYLTLGKLPSSCKSKHNWRTRRDPFKEDWSKVERHLRRSQKQLNATEVLSYLQEKFPGRYEKTLLRTLQRRLSGWYQRKYEEDLLANQDFLFYLIMKNDK